jgi:hypothetical protein
MFFFMLLKDTGPLYEIRSRSGSCEEYRLLVCNAM